MIYLNYLNFINFKLLFIIIIIIIFIIKFTIIITIIIINATMMKFLKWKIFYLIQFLISFKKYQN